MFVKVEAIGGAVKLNSVEEVVEFAWGLGSSAAFIRQFEARVTGDGDNLAIVGKCGGYYRVGCSK